MEVEKLGPGAFHLPFTGDIMGTFMGWLSDTEAGGATAFMSPGFNGIMRPKKGSALFWYDLMSDGKRDFSTSHGGCPVLKGTKWIMNKWLHAFDNFKKFPCSLDQNKRHEAPSKIHFYH